MTFGSQETRWSRFNLYWVAERKLSDLPVHVSSVTVTGPPAERMNDNLQWALKKTKIPCRYLYVHCTGVGWRGRCVCVGGGGGKSIPFHTCTISSACTQTQTHRLTDRHTDTHTHTHTHTHTRTHTHIPPRLPYSTTQNPLSLVCVLVPH